jgi:hypothetical protein
MTKETEEAAREAGLYHGRNALVPCCPYPAGSPERNKWLAGAADAADEACDAEAAAAEAAREPPAPAPVDEEIDWTGKGAKAGKGGKAGKGAQAPEPT